MTRFNLRGLLCALFANVTLCTYASASGLPVQTPGMIAAVAGVGEERKASWDDAARLTASRRYDEALAAMRREAPDSLRLGLVASLAGNHEEAIELLRHPSSNPFIERFRLYCAARSLLASGSFPEALETIRKIPYPPGSMRDRSDRFHVLARETEAKILAECDSLLALEGIPPDIAEFPGRVRYALGSALLRSGNDSTGAAEIRAACAGSWGREDRDILEEALSRCDEYRTDMTSAELRAAATNAIAARLLGAAGRIVEELLERDGSDGGAMLLKASVLAGEKRKREAASVCREILASAAPESIKREAHGKLVSLEYDLGHRERAVAMCREHATRFSDGGLLSFGGRIEISLGRLESAFGFFADIVAGDRAPAADDIASFAALGCILGREDESYRTIEKRVSWARAGTGAGQAGGRETPPSVLYWLWRTAPDASEKKELLSALLQRHPRSVYACVAGVHPDSLLAAASVISASERIRAMASAEAEFIDSITVAFGDDGALAGSEAYSAYLYFLDCGLVQEAYDCAVALGKGERIGKKGVLNLYREARGAGCYSLAVRILNVLPVNGMGGGVVERLRYPVAFVGAISAGAAAGIPPELSLAVMREESTFDPDAVSRAGAIGLMQLMPATARWLARKHGWQGGHCSDLRDAACNVAIGTWYMSYLLGRFDDSLVGALAAYNGGEGRMAKWRKQFDPESDPMVAMALIGPRETRSYVGKVLESMCRYRAIGSTGKATEQ